MMLTLLSEPACEVQHQHVVTDEFEERITVLVDLLDGQTCDCQTELTENDFLCHSFNVILCKVEQTLSALFMMSRFVLTPTVNVDGTLIRMFCSDRALSSGIRNCHRNK